MFRDWGSVPINSTAGTTADGIEVNPSTSTLIAEIDSTALNGVLAGGSVYQVSWLVGASTNAIWQLEQCASTSLATYRDRTYVQTSANQSGMFILCYKLEKGDRLRARLQTAITGVATAKVSAEPMT